MDYLSQNSYSHEIGHSESLLEKNEEEMTIFETELRQLSAVKDAIFDPDKLDNEDPIDIQDILKNLNTRDFGALEFHNETERYDTEPNDKTDKIFKNRTYRQAIMRSAQKLGLLEKVIQKPNNDFEKELKFSSNPEVYEDEVEAMVVAGAAGLTNYKRFYHTIKAISSGAIKTDKIIFAGCSRQTTDEEQKTLKQYGFECGKSEFELGLQAVNYIAGGFIDGTRLETENTVSFSGIEYPFKVVSGKININGKEITVQLVDSPFDKTRKLADGNPATRALTEETFVSAMALLEKDAPNKTICVVSHDTWKKGQKLAGEIVFGTQFGRNVIATGPTETKRLYFDELDELDARKAEAVVDELTKCYIKMSVIKNADITRT